MISKIIILLDSTEINVNVTCLLGRLVNTYVGLDGRVRNPCVHHASA